ncbi:putative Short-chain dehydrogenase/reductase [Seiridium cardinale]
MTTLARTIVATGASSGLGFEAVKQLLQQSQPYKFIIGARNLQTTQAAFDKVEYDATTHSVSILPLDLADLRTIKPFAQRTLETLEKDKIDILFLNAGMNKAADGPGLHGSKWCEAYLVNHLSQHYLVHLLRHKLGASHSRVVVVSSGLIRGVKEADIEAFQNNLKADSGADGFKVYHASKFVQFLGAHWWRRQLGTSATVLAVSPGLVVGTGLGRHLDTKPNLDHIPDKLTVEDGAKNLLRAFDQDDFPEDPEQILLTSWGEWWPKDIYALSLDKNLQDQWCPSREDIEAEAGITSSL